MNKQKSSGPKRAAAKSRPQRSDARRHDDAKKAPDADSAFRLPSRAAVRETIESIAIAFILAFLFRTFEAEAFVIPTGSMAPTLMGRHKEVDCPVCGYHYEVSASGELKEDGTPLGQGALVEAAICPMCGFIADLRPGNDQGQSDAALKGDRILVSKFAYELSDPERWDVVVFHFPGDAETNYIKRLIGRPGETIRIRHGDIFVRDDAHGDANFTITRKAPRKLLAMLQPVFDNDLMPAIMKAGFTQPRWNPEPSPLGGTAGAWSPMDDSRSFETDGSSQGEQWIRYSHLMPRPSNWRQLTGPLPYGSRPRAPTLKAELISDITAYNTEITRDELLSSTGDGSEKLGNDWVGDLALECDARVLSDSGEALFELVEGGRRFQCRIDVATGRATLRISGVDMADYAPTATTDFRGPGTHKIRFANCDDQLLLWVDDDLVAFDRPTTYRPLGNVVPERIDLKPVAIGTQGAALRVEHLKIFRDIYYIATQGNGNGPLDDFSAAGLTLPPGFLSDPRQWPDVFAKLESQRPVEFKLEKDQFLVLGDNSAKSKDSRLWSQGADRDELSYYVRRDLLIGKAFFIYWPDTRYKVPVGGLSLPYFPNFCEMGLVR